MSIIAKLVAAACGLAACAAVSGASALPMTPAAPAQDATSSLVQQIHGCHREVQRGRAGWHYHGRRCDRIAAPPPRRGEGRREFRRGGPPPRRPVCRQQCQYIGPFKQCKTVCN